MIDPTEFWTNPRAFEEDVDKGFLKTCVPEYFKNFDNISERIMWMIEASLPTNALILELGCNIGRNLYHLKTAGYKYAIGIEINPEAIELSKKYYGPLDIKQSSIQDFLGRHTIGKGVYDLIFTQSVFMHIPPKDDWIFEAISHITDRVLTHEVEDVGRAGAELNWSRNYREMFEAVGFEQGVAHKYGHQMLRMFAK